MPCLLSHSDSLVDTRLHLVDIDTVGVRPRRERKPQRPFAFMAFAFMAFAFMAFFMAGWAAGASWCAAAFFMAFFMAAIDSEYERREHK